MTDALSGNDLIVWLSIGHTSDDDPARQLEQLLEDELGVALDPGDDLELGSHARFAPDPLPDRGVVHVLAQDNRGDDAPEPARSDCGAVAKIDVAGDVLELGRLADRLARAGGDAVKLLAWGFHEPVLGDDVVLAARGGFEPGDPGRPVWLADIEPGAAGGAAAPGGPWLCQLAAGMGAVELEQARTIAHALLGGAWTDDVELHGPESRLRAPGPGRLGATLCANQPPTGAALFPERLDHTAILRLVWAAASPVELGWLAAVLERHGLELLDYRVAGIMTSDGVARLMTGRLAR